jgi:hypothetical protein
VEPLTGGLQPLDPVLFALCPQLNLLNTSKKFLGTPLIGRDVKFTLCVIDLSGIRVSRQSIEKIFVEHLEKISGYATDRS